jgi:predicted transcriptional regulator
MKRNLKDHIVTAFKPHGEGLGKLFGSLESDIMELLWEKGEASARDIFEGLRDQGQRLSYGAVKTVMDRLVKKNVLERTMISNQGLYRARLSREEFTSSAISEILGSLLDSFGDPVYAQFLDKLQASDPGKLDQLNQMIAAAEAKRQKTSGS